jgi:hypothetical protein
MARNFGLLFGLIIEALGQRGLLFLLPVLGF